MGRTILAVFAGLALGFVGIMVFEMIGHSIYPPPSVSDSATYKVYFDSSPIGALLLVIVAHSLGAFAGGVTAIRVDKGKKLAGIIVGIFFVLATIADLSNMLMMNVTPPLWFVVLDPLLVIISVFALYKIKIASAEENKTEKQ
ncbi:MAG: hypothetical protein JKY53_13990 [Flavobacteriales bacterium]|nr:hypothetical protein [Flavobacteriales bacterium]